MSQLITQNRISMSRRLDKRLIRLIKAPGENGLQKVLSYKKRFAKYGDFLFIACMPKSGSTFMTNVLSELTGYPYSELIYAYERNDHNLYLPKLIDSYSFGTVTHMHVRATASNIDLMKKFSIQPVILVRNIYDIVVSIRDHMFKESYEFPTFYCNERFTELSKTDQYDFIIELGIPWYFNFYVSWQVAESSKNIKTCWLTFEDVVQDWVKAIRTVVNFYAIEKNETEIEKAIERTGQLNKKKTRLNKGIIGRGQTELTSAQKEKIRKFARFYPWIDFSKIGIK